MDILLVHKIVFLFGTKLEGIQLQESTSFHRIVFLIYNCIGKLGLFRVGESLNLAFYLIHHMTTRIQAFIWGTARVFFSMFVVKLTWLHRILQ
jgi:hypothetical protein